MTDESTAQSEATDILLGIAKGEIKPEHGEQLRAAEILFHGRFTTLPIPVDEYEEDPE